MRVKAGDQAGDHALEVELTLDELADILGEELELPNIENKGKSAIIDKKDRYVGVRNVGPKLASALQAHVSQRASAPDRTRELRSQSARSSSRHAKTCATSPGRRRKSRSPTPSSYT